VLVAQFRARKYIPGIYWLAVVLVSVVGTLVSDNLVENGVTLEVTTIAFSICLIGVFAAWYASERTLSVHTIFTTRREGFYWATILFTFALGTSAGDLISEKLELGYLPTVGIFAGAIALIAFCHFALKMNAILSFWLAYIMTRPLGASIGDYLASPTEETGLGLGTTWTSIIFLSTILALVVFLAVSKRDVIRSGPVAVPTGAGPAVLVVLNKVAPTDPLIAAVRERVAAGVGRFHVLVPNPHNLGFDHGDPVPTDGEELLAGALPPLREAAGGRGLRPGGDQPQRLRRHRRRARWRRLHRDPPRDAAEPPLALAPRRPLTSGRRVGPADRGGSGDLSGRACLSHRDLRDGI